MKSSKQQPSHCLLLKENLHVIPAIGRAIYRIAGKFGCFAVYIITAKLKSAKISYSHIYVWRSRTEPPNLNPPIFLQQRFWAQPPNLIPANISGYTVHSFFPLPNLLVQVIEYLRRQQARQELLSMLYEVELRRHRETHRLLSAAEKQLSQWKEDGEKRSVSYEYVLSLICPPNIHIESSAEFNLFLTCLSSKLCRTLPYSQSPLPSKPWTPEIKQHSVCVHYQVSQRGRERGGEGATNINLGVPLSLLLRCRAIIDCTLGDLRQPP